MYKHILIPTVGSELSKLAIQEGVASAKALSARVTALTVTKPFHVFTTNPEYEPRLLHSNIWMWPRILPQRREYHVIWCTLNMSTLIGRLSIPLRAEAVTQYKWRHMDDAGYRRFCSAAKPSRC